MTKVLPVNGPPAGSGRSSVIFTPAAASFGHDLLVARLGHPGVQRLRHRVPDGVHGLDLFRRRRHQPLHAAEVPRQRLRRDLAHVAHAQAEEDAREPLLFGRLDAVQQVLRGLLLEALQRQQLLFGQRVDVAHVVHHAALQQELAMVRSPSPRMSIAPRETKCASPQ